MSKQYNNLSLVRKFIKYLYPYLYLELALFFLMIIANIGSLATPYFLKIIIDDIFPKGDYRGLIDLLATLIFIYIIRILCTVATDILYTRVSVKIISDIRGDMLANILHRPISFFKEARSGEVLFTVMNDVENIQGAFSSLILNFLNNIISIVGIIIMLGFLNAELTLISLLIFPFILVSIRKFTPHLQKSFARMQQAEEKQTGFFLEKLNNIRVVKSYNAFGHEQDKLKRLQKESIAASIRNSMLNTFNSNITTFFIAIGPVIVLMYGGKGVFHGVMTIGVLIAFIQYLNRLYAPAVNVMESYNYFNRAIVSMKRVSEYIDTVRRKEDPDLFIPEFSRIVFKNVSLQLSGRPILRGLNLTFEKGKIYCIIGPSGSGKSSISNLICGFLPPTEGEILADDTIPIHKIRNWHSVLGLIEKENQVFNDSILENIRYGSFKAGSSDVLEAAGHSKFIEVIETLHEGLQTTINETGTMLSDGQKQRISVARALLKRPAIIIFDEATSSFDINLEQSILNNLRIKYNEAIIIIITHRMNILEKVDYVYSISRGMVVKEGHPMEGYHQINIL